VSTRDSEALASLVRLIADRAANPLAHRTKICFLLGAGADISSGGLSFAELKRQAVEEFTKRPLFDVTLPEEIDARFEDLFGRLQPDDRALLVEAIFRRMQPLRPSDAYKLLVLLAEAGGIDAVVTTNFDVMLEQAQHELGRDPFQVFAPGLARPYLLTDSRYELPRKPYLKLHGDIACRSVTQLTSEELNYANYDSSMLELLVSILQTHDLIVAGYSGYDAALARVIADAVSTTTNRVYWCNPHPPSIHSALYSALADRTRVVRISFDDLLMEVSRPVLERPSLARSEPTFLRCLFDWRVEYANREYIKTYGERSGKPMVDVFARRRLIEDRLTAFLLTNRPLAIVTGPSGFGKTTLGIRLHKVWGTNGPTRIFLIRSQTLPESGDVEQHVAEQLGGLGAHGPFSFFRLEHWLAEHNLRFVLFIDGINEFNPDLARCVHLFRNILRVCYFLAETNSRLRVVVTVRQESWNAMLPHLDSAQLRKTLWSEEESPQSFSTIACGALTDEELNDALTRLRDHGYASIATERLSPAAADQLRDPYLLGMISEAAHHGLPPVPSAGIYRRAFEEKLRRRGSFIDLATLNDILSSLALNGLKSKQDRFREIDIHPATHRGEIVRLMKDLHVFVDAGDGFLQFDHDRTFQYFLALGLASGAEPSLETTDDLLRFLRRFKTQGKAIAAARLFFQLRPGERFDLISGALGLLDARDDRYGSSDREILFSFAREVVVEMAEQGEPLVEQYLGDAIDAGRSGVVGEHRMRTVVQAAASLPVQKAVPLLSRVAHAKSYLARTEANIFAIDKVVKQYLSSGCPPLDLFQDEPYASFFNEPSITRWQKLGRLIGLAAQLGPDNTHPDEYRNVLRVLNAALDRLSQESSPDVIDAQTFADFFLENCDRLLFNATPGGIESFFDHPCREEFKVLLERLAAGGVVTEHEVDGFAAYTQSLQVDVAYHLCHIFYILSGLNDLEATLRVAEARFEAFSNDTPPVEVDFYQGVLVYLHIVHALPYDELRFGPWEEVVLRSWPDVLLFAPGAERGERRGFQDLFDRIFEDGFGVIYPYGILMPGIRRRRSHYAEYRRDLAAETFTQLPMYSKYLEAFLRAERIEEALQILQALGGVIVVWPTEGLLTLRGVIGYHEPRIRRATIRILAEAFNRHPEETMHFLKTSGAALSDEDLLEIKIRQDARVGRRQIEAEEWARVGHFLLRRPAAREQIVLCLRVLLRAPTFQAAVTEILQVLGLSSVIGR
jgi:hypothetical protein